MKKLGLLALMIRVLSAQTSPCDVNKDGVVNIADVQTIINEALGVTACTNMLDGASSCDVADVQIVITAALGGACNAVQPAQSNIQLPVEVIGLDGTTKTASFNVPTGSNLSGAMQLSLQIHGVHYQTQASVQVNNSAWMPINNGTATVLGMGNLYGGIGGGYHTLKLTMSLPPGTVTTGTNTITFRFNGTDGRRSGFRVLGFNILDTSGNSLIPSSTFAWDDPNSWQPPSTSASDIAAGKSLWYTAPLTVPRNGATPILAHCTDCHAQDGRDLKYFNYSNNSIQVRSMFHGLTAQQGAQIASYIRTLNVPNPGRPWNPPYQPGPGLDSLPVADWSAGAGINAVLDHDADMLPYLMPGGSTAQWAPTASLSAREVPVTFQLPDWNMWLPGVHPMDYWGSTFLNNRLYTNYQTIRANLTPNDPVSYASQKQNIWLWATWDINFLNPMTKSETDPGWSDAVYAAAIPSLRMWSMTKLWEVNQEFGLEGMAQTAFGSQADSRAWYSLLPFYGSPNMMHLPTSIVENGLPLTYDYLSQAWYQTQLILNASNNRGTHAPVSADFPYTYNHIDALTFGYNPLNSPQGLLTTLWEIKALQASENGNGPQFGSAGWSLNNNDPVRFIEYAFTKWDSRITPADRTNIISTYLQLWLSKVTSYTPAQYYAGNYAKPTDPIRNVTNLNFGSRIAYAIPMLSSYGVSSTLTDQMITWAQTVWTSFNWSSLKNAVCTPGKWDPVCTW